MPYSDPYPVDRHFQLHAPAFYWLDPDIFSVTFYVLEHPFLQQENSLQLQLFYRHSEVPLPLISSG